ncbi:DUF2889 domain-containing protein [Pusillimonas sp. ANT_WB101]|uniref:DUF2889 domain-containing protein n=1 Tax=Pusillimonas sp. ANT_WB101 TaxID=2597356 RepID=UPI0011EEDF5A|nr:DUF2889 domain-containing protein [Pusillimonas sp. ANT_WB101]KAA0911697.1 DUF2889 domain-containing protein [Pusillimonas sp. ANT_WB101]NYT77935.1 DUF2889 domain-containing protein [Alcaligenaceae bacterium]
MPLPPPDTAREPLHTRSIRVNSFARDDGLWDIEAELIDFKAYDYSKHSGAIQRAGVPFHHMHLRITIDEQFTIVKAVAAYDAAPYNQNCTAITPDYGQLAGMNLLRNFRNAVKERFGRVAGCTHLTELSFVLPTVAVQTMANQRHQKRKEVGDTRRPFQLEGCHALRLDGEVAREYYPQWYVTPKVKAKCV